MVSLSLSLSLGSQALPARRFAKNLDKRSHDMLISVQLLQVSEHTARGDIVSAILCPWKAIANQIEKDPDFLWHFPKYPRKFEEFVAGTYERDGYSVTLTPASADGGLDIIAEKSGFGAVRIIDQCKAFRKGRSVGLNDVRAMMGTLSRFPNASKAVITTTSRFSPGVRKEWSDHIPFRLELREGGDLLELISKLK